MIEWILLSNFTSNFFFSHSVFKRLVLQKCKNQDLFGNELTQAGYFSASPVIPIADIKGTEAMSYTKGEKILRCKLAACYRLVDLNGWSHGIYNHISVSNISYQLWS